jgi:hypothetical protein
VLGRASSSVPRGGESFDPAIRHPQTLAWELNQKHVEI